MAIARLLWLLATLAGAPGAAALAQSAESAVAATDSLGRVVSLPRPATRALTLAPHATELVYAAGAGARMAASVNGSDYPPQAARLPSIGDGTQPDPERIAALEPDLVIAWQPGAVGTVQPVLQALRVPVFYSDPQVLADIPATVSALGSLFGTTDVAEPAAAAMRGALAAIAREYAGRPPVRVFIQAGSQPLYTLNGRNIINDAVRLCGGVNIFANAPIVAPQTSTEAVIAARPDAVLVGVHGPGGLRETAATWKRAALPAALAGHVYGMDADMLYRPGPRLIDATRMLCVMLDRARAAPVPPARAPASGPAGTP